MNEKELEELFGKGAGDPDMQLYYPGEEEALKVAAQNQNT